MRRVLYGLAGLLTVCAVALLVIGGMWQPHGVSRTLYGDDDYTRAGRWLWLALDGADFERVDGLNGVNRVHFDGIIWQGEPGETTWRIVHTGNLVVRVDGETVFQVDSAVEHRADVVQIAWANSWLRVEIDLTDINLDPTQQTVDSRLEMGIYEPAPLGGWQMIPSHRLYEQPPDAAYAQRAILLATANPIIIGVMVMTGLVWLVSMLWVGAHGGVLLPLSPNPSPTRREGLNSAPTDTLPEIGGRAGEGGKIAWLTLAITLLALVVRFVVMIERAGSDPLFYFLTPGGDDNYIVMGRQVLSGQYALAGTFWPPGSILWFAGIAALVGPQLWKVYVANILISGFAAGAVTLAAWQAFGRRIALLSGLIFALYPPLVFYQSTTQSVVLDAALTAFALLAGVTAIRRRSVWFACLFGVLIGLAGLSRGTGLLLGVAFFLALLGLWRENRRVVIRLTAVAAVSAVLVLLPQSLANWRAGEGFSLVPYSNGSLTLYSGNNRDADGIWTGRGMAWASVFASDQDWTGALLDDFRDDPLRMVELNLRKLALFWNNDELLSNVDYHAQGLADSALLRALSLDGRIGMVALSFFVWLGMVGVMFERRPAAWFVWWSALWLIAGTVLFVVAGRLRVPVLPVLVILAAVGVNMLMEAARLRQISRRLVLAAVVAGVMLVGLPMIEDSLPPKRSADISQATIPRDVNFGEQVHLIGFDPIQTNHQPGGTVYVTLYWQAVAPVTADYRVFVELADESGRVVGVDATLGTVGFPPVGTSEWHAGQIIREGYLLELPDNLPPVLDLNVGLYHPDTGERLVTSEGQPFIRLTRVGFETDTVPGGLGDDAHDAAFTVGNHLMLTGYALPEQVQAGEPLTIQLEWTAQQMLYEDTVIFVHVVDANGELVAQSDSPALTDGWTTSALIPGKPLGMTRTLRDALPPGEYTVRVGAYRFPFVSNLPVMDAAGNPLADGVIPLGTVRVTDGS